MEEQSRPETAYRQGARQIGKTCSIERFARQNCSSVILINFVEQKRYRNIFDDGFEVDVILLKFRK